MNIFYLDKDPLKCATLHCDKHCVKMIIEYAQLLSTAHRVLDNNTDVYKVAHLNHPSTIWTRKNKSNYKWLAMLWTYLCCEYTHRYEKTHMTEKKLRSILVHAPKNIPDGYFIEPPQCMPEDVKRNSSITAYQEYYKKYKRYFARWTNRPMPQFMENV
tara:strand:+ start:160 stop:633 length:474 start_codon:yes stop_codon:yes gene_type:complete